MRRDTRRKRRRCRFGVISRIFRVGCSSRFRERAKRSHWFADPKNATAYGEAQKKLGQTVIVQGVMMPAKDLKAPVPIQVSQVK
jgi:hypothetical protein